MKNTFKKLVEQLLTEGDNDYSTKVNATLYIAYPEEVRRNYDYDMSFQVNVNFEVDMEARSWGIKTLNIIPTSIEPIEAEIREAETGNPIDTMTISVDPLKLKINLEKPENYIGLGGLELVVTPDGQVDYNRSYLQSFGI